MLVKFICAFLFLFSLQVAAHGGIIAIKGTNGKSGVGFGIIDTSGKKIPLFFQVARYLNRDQGNGKANVCGSNRPHHDNNFIAIPVQSNLQARVNAGLPSFSAGGIVKMTLFQVNNDGAGPYTMEVSPDGLGKKFVKMTVTKNVPGNRGRSNAVNKAFDLEGRLPSSVTKCTGPGGACLIRVKSGINQPFGGCAAIKLAGGGKRMRVMKRTSGDDVEEISVGPLRIQNEPEDFEDPQDIDEPSV